jgi:hypothetical protein
MKNKDLLLELWESDQACALTNRAAREIERLNDELKSFGNAAVHEEVSTVADPLHSNTK